MKRLLLSLLLLGASSLMGMENPQGQEALLNKVAQELLKIDNQIRVYKENRASFGEQKKANDFSKITNNLTNLLSTITNLEGYTSLKNVLGSAIASALAYNEQSSDTAQSNINTLQTKFSQALSTMAGYIKAPQAKITRATQHSAFVTFDKPLSKIGQNLVTQLLNKSGVTTNSIDSNSANLAFPALTSIDSIIVSLNLNLINQPLNESQLVRNQGSITSDTGTQIIIKFNKPLTADEKNKIINYFNNQKYKHTLTFSTDNTELTIIKEPYHSSYQMAEFINNLLP